MIARRVSRIALVSLVVAIGVACGPPAAMIPSGQQEGSELANQIVFVGDAQRSIGEGDELRMEVRYLKASGAVIPGGFIELALEGDTAGASLSHYGAETDDNGLAAVTLRAGTLTSFEVVATADGVAEPAVATVNVIEPSTGTLRVDAAHNGDNPVRTLEAGVFIDATCADLRDDAPPTVAAGSARVNSPITFESIPVGRAMAVYVFGIDREDLIAAEGCAELNMDGTEGRVTIDLLDVPELLTGSFDVTEELDVTSGFNSTLDALLEAMTGLSADPARYIVDVVAQSDATPGWLQSALDPSIMRTIVAGLLRDALGGIHLPSYMTEVLELGANLDRAFSHVTLRGDLELAQPDEFNSSESRHSIVSIAVPVGESQEERRVNATADIVATIAEELTLPEHTLDIAFGRAVEIVLEDIVLPTLPGEPRSMEQLGNQLFDCDAIAGWLAGDSSLGASVANGVCSVAVGTLSALVEDYVLGLMDYDQLHLQGSATLADLDQDYDRESITDGELNARWTGRSGEMSFSGTMTGTFETDLYGGSNPIRNRIFAQLY